MLLLTIAFYIFIVVIAVQTFFYVGIFAKFSSSSSKQKSNNQQPISVIICAKNEEENLKEFLPSILAQDYPNFEIILINDSSSDDTLEVMEAFKAKDGRIKIVDVKSIEVFWGNKKYALTLGIKAAKHDTLLFTDADCKPVSTHWISQMSSHFSDTKSLVLGYGGYEKIKNSFLNKIIRFETLLTATQYFSYAAIGMPYMAVGRNLAYKSDLFYEAKGFMNHMDILSGDDDLFVNQVATKSNTALCFSEESFTISKPKTTYRNWILQKRRHVNTATRYKLKHQILLALFYSSQILFWVLAITLLSLQFNWIIVATLSGFRFIMLYTIFAMTAKKFNEKDLLLFLPIFEIFLIIAQFFIFIKNISSKPNHWK